MLNIYTHTIKSFGLFALITLQENGEPSFNEQDGTLTALSFTPGVLTGRVQTAVPSSCAKGLSLHFELLGLANTQVMRLSLTVAMF